MELIGPHRRPPLKMAEALPVDCLAVLDKALCVWALRPAGTFKAIWALWPGCSPRAGVSRTLDSAGRTGRGPRGRDRGIPGHIKAGAVNRPG